MPRRLMMRRPCAETRRRTQRFIVGTQKRWYCRFGLLRVFDLLFAWLTLFPTSGRFPVTWQTRDMTWFLLPARLHDAGELALQRLLAEGDARELEVAEVAAG